MRRWCTCNPHPRNRRYYVLVVSLLLGWFLIMGYQRHQVFKGNLQNPDSGENENGGGVQKSPVVNNGRVPKQVKDPDFQQTTQSPSTTEVEDIASTTPVVLTEKSELRQSRDPATPEVTRAGVPLPSLSELEPPEKLQKFMLKHNHDPPVANSDHFPPLRTDDIVLVVQVHKRDKYLGLLLESLKAAKGIENALLVISHDYYYDEVNKLVKSVDFCKVIQLFYPLSLQVVPNSFPGSSKNDCPRDASKAAALKMNCTNAKHPDSYGHYREAIVTAIKHHWWWKVNTVFDHLAITKEFKGYAFFLEEDHYVAPDFLEVAKQLIQLREDKCRDCDFLNLGMYTALRSFDNQVSRGIWNAGKNNMGFGMNRATWSTIRDCSEYFCSYDDYNWDWSINQLGKACPLINRDLNVMVIKTPRIFHIGTCGTHHRKSCNEQNDGNMIRNKIASKSGGLFPKNLVFSGGIYPQSNRRKIKPYGGWGDIRDHELCMKMASRDSYPT